MGGHRRFGVHHYRQVVVRQRQTDKDRGIARTRLMGRPKAAAFRALAVGRNRLDPVNPLPDDAAIATAVGQTESAPR